MCRCLAEADQSIGVIIPRVIGITCGTGFADEERTQADSSKGQRPITFDTVREIARELPGAIESTSYGTPAFKVGKCLFARQHQDGESLVIKIDPAQRR